MRKQLEIYAINDFPDMGLRDLEKRDLILNNKFYRRIDEKPTRYLKLQKKPEKFREKMHNLIRKMGRKINADMVMIVYTGKHYPDNTANYDVVFYKEKLPNNFINEERTDLP